MNKPVEQAVVGQQDTIQEKLASYAHSLRFEDIPSQAVHAAKVRIIDTLGALMGGFFGEPCQLVRNRSRARGPRPRYADRTRSPAPPQ